MSIRLRFGGQSKARCLPSLDAQIRDAMRRCIADEIDRLVTVLDELNAADADADAEPAGDDEPSLGWSEFKSGYGWRNNGQSNDDREDDAGDNGEIDEDREPVLGWTGAIDQA